MLSKGPSDFHNGSGRLELGERIFSDAAALSARIGLTHAAIDRSRFTLQLPAADILPPDKGLAIDGSAPSD